jgi:hypothetical protein
LQRLNTGDVFKEDGDADSSFDDSFDLEQDVFGTSRGNQVIKGDFPELHECPVGQEYVLPARLLSPHRPCSRPDWFGVAQIHAGFQYPDPSHWSQQPDWYNIGDNYELKDVA